MPSMNDRIAVEPSDQGFSSGLLRFEWIRAQAGFVERRIRVERRHLAPTHNIRDFLIRDFLAEAGLTSTA
jgi:hypothetical protein